MSTNRAYCGFVGGGAGPRTVLVLEANGRRGGSRKLSPRLGVINHSPDGFSWGYSGSGPAQLALAILCDHLRSCEEDRLLIQKAFGGDLTRSLSGRPKPSGNVMAMRLHQAFKERVIARLDQEKPFTLRTDEVSKVIGELIAERRAEEDALQA